jgi:DNA/RNA-binding domain of Phe-tRNA-synthetase-like protein
MKVIELGEDLLNVCPDVELGCIYYQVEVKKECKELWDEINKRISFIEKKYSIEDIYKEKNIIDSRNLYKSIGKDPNRYRISSESLMRRIVKGKGLYKVNNVVDTNNLISINSMFSVGSYDLDKLGDNLVFRIGQKNESYKGIGKDIINTENLPVFSDENGAYGSPTSDSEKAMITNDTKNVMTVLISFSSNSDLREQLEKSKELIEKYLTTSNVEMHISKKKILKQ